MKKISILAAALLMTGVASAQIASPSVGANPGANALTLPVGTTSISGYTRNISTIEQVGTNQHGVVTQNGVQNSYGSRQNEASLKQISSSPSTGSNNATQTQTNDASGGGSSVAISRAANRMEAEQFGTRSTVTQSQQGSGNRASAFQRAGSTENLIVQTQVGRNNQAYSEQRGHDSKSVQTQNGVGNQGVVIQTGPAGYNLATQDQTGTGNTAYAGQGTQGNPGGISYDSGYNHSAQMQNGMNNFSRTDQFGSDDWSKVSQTGTTNTAIVTQR